SLYSATWTFTHSACSFKFTSSSRIACSLSKSEISAEGLPALWHPMQAEKNKTINNLKMGPCIMTGLFRLVQCFDIGFLSRHILSGGSSEINQPHRFSGPV